MLRTNYYIIQATGRWGWDVLDIFRGQGKKCMRKEPLAFSFAWIQYNFETLQSTISLICMF